MSYLSELTRSRPRSALLTLTHLIGLPLLFAGCATQIPEDQTLTVSQKGTYDGYSDYQIADTFRPKIHFRSDHRCMPLNFTISPDQGDSCGSVVNYQDCCKDNFDPEFAIVAKVKRSNRSDTFRITYGVPFGKQIAQFDTTTLFDEFGWDVVGTHGHDAQYLVVDVVDGVVKAVWADLHQGYYTRVASRVVMDGNHPTAWAAKYGNGLKLVTDQTTCLTLTADDNYSGIPSIACFSPAAAFITPNLNFGEPTGEDHTAWGKLVMQKNMQGNVSLSDVCQSGDYTADGKTWSGASLTALKAYVGCNAAPYMWTSPMMDDSRTAYSDPYQLKGCDGGKLIGGSICNAAHFGKDDFWNTSGGTTLAIEPVVVGSADVDYVNGTGFNYLKTTDTAQQTYYADDTTPPTSITIYAGSRIRGISTTFKGGTTVAHGNLAVNSDVSVKTLTGLDSDPIISVELCEGVYNTTALDASLVSDDYQLQERAGRIKLTTSAGRILTAGGSNGACVTIAPAGKQLFGFFGKASTEVKVLGTIWGALKTAYFGQTGMGSSTAGSGVAIANIGGDEQKPDAVYFHVDANNGQNSGHYRIAWDFTPSTLADGTPAYKPTNWSAMRATGGGYGTKTSGAGIAMGNIDQDSRPDMVVVWVEDRDGADRTFYRIGKNFTTAGEASTWEGPFEITAGFHGNRTSGADVALYDINGNGQLDMVLATVDNADGSDVIYWTVGWDLSTSGTTSTWSGTHSLPVFGYQTAELGLDVADMDGNGKPDLVVSWVDAPDGTDGYYSRIGYDIGSSGDVTAGWGSQLTLHDKMEDETEGADLAIWDFDYNGSKDLLVHHVTNPTGENTAVGATKMNQSSKGYTVVAKHSGSCLGVGGSSNGGGATQWVCNGNLDQKWALVDAGGGFFHLKVKDSGKCLGASGSMPGTQTTQWDCWGGEDQKWSVVSNGTGYVNLVNKNSGLCLDVYEGSQQNGVSIVQGSCNNQDNQRWTLSPLPEIYSLTAKHSSKCAGVGGTSNGGGATQWECLGNADQKWMLIDAKDGFHYLKMNNSGKCLGVGGQTPGTQATQWTCWSGEDQKWKLVPNGTGFVNLVNKNSGQCLDVYEDSQSNGAHMVQWSCNNQDNQRWKFNPL